LFDFVVSISVMEHIPQLEAVLHEVARVLKPGGHLVATVPGIGFHRCLRGPLLPGQSRDEYLQALDRRVAHLRYWSVADWKRALTEAGLDFTEARPIQSRSEVRRWETISRLTAGVLHAVSRGSAPIEIQRSLGLRRAGQKLPAPLAGALASALALGVDSSHPSDERESGCLLVTAIRPRQPGMAS
jgi:SAM-dependent methyltransferase